MSPPAMSASTTNTRRPDDALGHNQASARIVVVTPGEPFADVNAMTATSVAPRLHHQGNPPGRRAGGQRWSVTGGDSHVDHRHAIQVRRSQAYDGRGDG